MRNTGAGTYCFTYTGGGTATPKIFNVISNKPLDSNVENGIENLVLYNPADTTQTKDINFTYDTNL
jgi:hypothetical protein